jgi:hypothetical protein
MQNVKIDIKIARVLKNALKTERFQKRFGKYTLKGFVSHCVERMLTKPQQCFECDLHRSLLAEIEIGRQQLGQSAEAPSDGDGDWVQCEDEVAERAHVYAGRYGGAMKDIVEQAILEVLLRPTPCDKCEFGKTKESK